MESTISLDLYNVPLLEALRSVAHQIELRVVIGPNYVQLVTPASELPTKEFFVPSLFFGGDESEPLHSAPSSFFDRGHGYEKSLLERRGITFPAGTYAAYFPRFQKLIVHNTQDNIELVQALVLEYYSKKNPTPIVANP